MRPLALILMLAMPAECARPNEACVGVLSSSIAKIEGYWTPGTIAQRQNNPGCLRRNGVYRTFATRLDGWKALRREIERKWRAVGLDVMLAKWSTTEGYGERVKEIAGERMAWCK